MKIKKFCSFMMLLIIVFLFIDWLFSYTVTSSVICSGGTKSTGSTYELLSTAGQSVIGNSSGGNYSMETGFIGATDNVPPTDIVNLTALQGLSVGQIILKWTAHGDDKDIGNIWQELIINNKRN